MNCNGEKQTLLPLVIFYDYDINIKKPELYAIFFYCGALH